MKKGGKMDKSPSLVKKHKPNISFFDAIKEVAKGHKVHKLEWGDKEFYCHMVNGALSLHKPDMKDYAWLVRDADMAGNDWIVL